MFGKKYKKFTILYKSGNSMTFEAEDVSVEWDTSTGMVTRFQAHGLKDDRFVFVGLVNIEAVWVE